MSLFSLLSLTVTVLGLVGGSAHAQSDLAPAHEAPAQHQYQLVGNRFLSVREFYSNDSTIAVDRAFFINWFLSSKPVGGCSSLSFESVRSQSYLVAYQYIDGLLGQTAALGFASKVDLSLPIDSAGHLLPEGWYCLTSEANTGHSAPETNFQNNLYTHAEPLCYGLSCPKESEPSLRLYPNPATSVVHVQLPKEFQSGTGQILIYDAAGKLVQSWEGDLGSNSRGEMTLTISRLPFGTYVMTLQSPSGRVSTRFERFQ